MDIYYYCSYTKSPVGFILGKLNGVNEAGEPMALSKDGIEPLIRKCFELGLVRKACGLLTQEPKRYFLLLKKLVTRGGDSDLDYYLNIAFVTESQQQYQQWMDVDEAVAEDTIAQAIRETILVDRESDFGYKVNSKSLAKLAGSKFGSLFGKCGTAVSGPYFELTSHSADPDDVMQALGIADDTLTLEPVGSGNWVCLSKKKAKLNRNIIWIILLAVAAAALVLLWKHEP